MELVFNGISRRVFTHKHKASRAKWKDARTIRGSVGGLGLTGDFYVEVYFEKDELLAWIDQFVTSEPQEAVEVLGALHSKAIVELVKRSHQDTDT